MIQRIIIALSVLAAGWVIWKVTYYATAGFIILTAYEAGLL